MTVPTSWAAVDLVGGVLELVHISDAGHRRHTYRVRLDDLPDAEAPPVTVLINLTDDERQQWAAALRETP
jgi:hypothetical protein